MKVVINACYGGFGLSPLAVKRMAELQGKPCYFFVSEGGGFSGRKLRVEMPDERSWTWSAYTVPNPDEVAISSDNWAEMTQEQRAASNESWERIALERRDIKRDDPTLIQVVEELGERANGSHANLKVVDIPDGTEWEISEYDGFEKVEEAHQSWG